MSLFEIRRWKLSSLFCMVKVIRQKPIVHIQYYRLLVYLSYYLLYPPHPLVLEFGPQ